MIFTGSWTLWHIPLMWEGEAEKCLSFEVSLSYSEIWSQSKHTKRKKDIFRKMATTEIIEWYKPWSDSSNVFSLMHSIEIKITCLHTCTYIYVWVKVLKLGVGLWEGRGKEKAMEQISRENGGKPVRLLSQWRCLRRDWWPGIHCWDPMEGENWFDSCKLPFDLCMGAVVLRLWFPYNKIMQNCFQKKRKQKGEPHGMERNQLEWDIGHRDTNRRGEQLRTKYNDTLARKCHNETYYFAW